MIRPKSLQEIQEENLLLRETLKAMFGEEQVIDAMRTAVDNIEANLGIDLSLSVPSVVGKQLQTK